MSENLRKLLSANAEYTLTNPGLKELTPFPKKEIVLITCMDVRLDPLRFTGLNIGDVNILRNAGGRVTDDTIRSLVICYKFLGAKEFFLVMHTNCGMQSLDNKTICDLLSGSLNRAEFDGEKWNNLDTGNGSPEGQNIDWMTIDNLEETLIKDVKKIRNHPLIPDYIKINGLIIDIETGKLWDVISI